MNQRVALHTISVPERERGATFRHSWSLFATGLRTLVPQVRFRVSGDGDTQSASSTPLLAPARRRPCYPRALKANANGAAMSRAVAGFGRPRPQPLFRVRPEGGAGRPTQQHGPQDALLPVSLSQTIPDSLGLTRRISPFSPTDLDGLIDIGGEGANVAWSVTCGGGDTVSTAWGTCRAGTQPQSHIAQQRTPFAIRRCCDVPPGDSVIKASTL